VKTALFNIPDYNIIKNPILSRSEMEEFPHFFYHPTQAKAFGYPPHPFLQISPLAIQGISCLGTHGINLAKVKSSKNPFPQET